MAWATWREKGALTFGREDAPRSDVRVIISGILVNLLNPTLTIFFFAFLPQFVPRDELTSLPRMMELSSVFMLATFIVFAVYGVFAAAARHHVIAKPKVMTWLRRVFAGSFVALGARLVMTERWVN
jgi:threonine/homoserine/homoserine lactone efflux protein